jgi:sugar phosphate isomerase/epimerase
VEPHGYCTTKPELMQEILSLYDSPYFGMNMDTGNTFIAGRDPVAFLEQFRGKINHIHIKDVSKELEAALKGQATGIALSACAIGDGVNAGNIRKCMEILVKSGFDGVMSLECDAQGGPMLERSLNWTRQTLADVQARAATI